MFKVGDLINICVFIVSNLKKNLSIYWFKLLNFFKFVKKLVYWFKIVVKYYELFVIVNIVNWYNKCRKVVNFKYFIVIIIEILKGFDF